LRSPYSRARIARSTSSAISAGRHRLAISVDGLRLEERISDPSPLSQFAQDMIRQELSALGRRHRGKVRVLLRQLEMRLDYKPPFKPHL
jgi:hypothetical protein